MEGTGRGPRPGLTDLIRSPGVVMTAATVAALIGVLVILQLGIRSMRLDDIRADLGEMRKQREVFLKATDEDRKHRALVIDYLRKLDERAPR